MNYSSKGIKSLKITIVSLIVFTILLSASFAYYSFTANTKYNINVGSSNVRFELSNVTNYDIILDGTKLTEEDFMINETTYGYLSEKRADATIILESGKNNYNVYCDYEIWYLQSGYFKERQLTHYLTGFKGIHNKNGIVKEFETPSHDNTSRKTIYKGRIAANNTTSYNYWSLYEKLYDYSNLQYISDTYIYSYGGEIIFKSRGCHENKISLSEGYNQKRSLLIGSSEQISVINDSNDTINVTVSDPSVLSAVYNETNSTLTVNKIGGGNGRVYLNSNSGYAEITYESDIEITNIDDIMEANNGHASLTSLDGNNGYKYNPKYKGISISTSSLKSSLKTYSSNTTKLSDVIKNKSYETSSRTDWKVKEAAIRGNFITRYSYRYQGTDPDNYVWFNNERWRIIGALKGERNTADANHNQIRIVRATPLVISGLTHMSLEDILAFLNTDYFNSGETYPCIDDMSCHTCQSENSFYYCSDEYKVTDKKSIEMVEKTYWYYFNQSASNQNNSSIPRMAELEKDQFDKEYYVGLPTLSDLTLAVFDNADAYNTSISNYKTWLTQKNENVKLALMSNRINVECQNTIDVFGLINGYEMRCEYPTYENTEPIYLSPTVNLKDSVKVYSGDGSYHNPYVIGVD